MPRCVLLIHLHSPNTICVHERPRLQRPELSAAETTSLRCPRSAESPASEQKMLHFVIRAERSTCDDIQKYVEKRDVWDPRPTTHDPHPRACGHTSHAIYHFLLDHVPRSLQGQLVTETILIQRSTDPNSTIRIQRWSGLSSTVLHAWTRDFEVEECLL